MRPVMLSLRRALFLTPITVYKARSVVQVMRAPTAVRGFSRQLEASDEYLPSKFDIPGSKFCGSGPAAAWAHPTAREGESG
jgi:hypothetical protein